jgi:hypothetical protein
VEPVWDCEDEDEARGLATVLERAGILVALRDVGGRLAIDVPPEAEPRARALIGRIAGVHALQLDRLREAKRRARDRFFQRASWVAAGITAVVWLVTVAV